MKKYRPLILGMGLLLVLAVCGGAVAIFLPPEDVINLSAVRLPGEAIGREWTGPSGLVVQDFQVLSGDSEDEKKTIAILRAQLAPAGVIGVADFTYRQKGNPLSQVTVKIYVFQSSEQCQKWIQDKYQAPGWESLYRKVKKTGCLCFDSQLDKIRIAATGRVLIMSSSQDHSDIHLKALDLYLKRLW